MENHLYSKNTFIHELSIADTYKQQRFTVNTVHLLYKLAEGHIMPGTN